MQTVIMTPTLTQTILLTKMKQIKERCLIEYSDDHSVKSKNTVFKHPTN